MSPTENDCRGPLHPRAIEGLELFNQGKYWHAHEALEAAWRQETGEVRDLYRGILQAAVVYLHVSRGNYAGAVKVYGRSHKWLDRWPEVCRGVEVGRLRRELDEVMQEVEKLGEERIGELNLDLLKPVLYKIE